MSVKTAAEIQTLRKKIETVVEQSLALGLPKVPQTALECHAFELGRVAALKWAAPDEAPAVLNAKVKKP